VTGIQLSLLMGDLFAPRPPSAEVMESLESAQVTNSLTNNGFQLSFKVGSRSSLVTSLLPNGDLDPLTTRVILSVVVGGTTTVLIDGVVTRHEMVPSNDPGKSTLTITGEDLTVLMDLLEVPLMRYPAMTENLRVMVCLAKYAGFGIMPVALPPVLPDFPIPIESIPCHQGTDLAYVKQLASAVGYVFFLYPGPAPGSSIAYWGPDLRIPDVQRALTVNMGPDSNVDSLSFSLDGKAKEMTFAWIADPVTRRTPIPVVVPNINLLRPPLGARLGFPAKVKFMDDTLKLPFPKAASKLLGLMFRSNAEMVSASGSLDVLRYGDVLRARMLVGVRGAGITYDGLYYVNSVTHNLKRGEFKQSFTLSRDGLGATTSTVPT
jgi:hypothetical protein